MMMNKVSRFDLHNVNFDIGQTDKPTTQNKHLSIGKHKIRTHL